MMYVYMYISIYAYTKSVNIVESPYLKLLLEPRRRLSIVVVENYDAQADFSAILSAVANARAILILWVLVHNRTGQFYLQ